MDGILMRVSDVFLGFPEPDFCHGNRGGIKRRHTECGSGAGGDQLAKYAGWPEGRTLAVRQSEYIAAARLSGSSSFRIILRHVIPNIAGTVLVTAMLDIGVMMMEIAALSFLGLGAQPPTAEWGSMMSSGRSMLQTYPWVVLTPGLAIFVSVVCLICWEIRSVTGWLPEAHGRKETDRRTGNEEEKDGVQRCF